MVVLGLLLTLTAGAVVMGGLGSLARHKNVQVPHLFHGRARPCTAWCSV